MILNYHLNHGNPLILLIHGSDNFLHLESEKSTFIIKDRIFFQVEITGDELSFDYKLSKGFSKSFNATQLMRNIGIDI